MADPIVTVVISPREGHFLSESSLASVLADDATPFELVYLDIASPPKMQAALEAQAAAHGFRLIRYDDWMAPSRARKAILGEIATPYVAFADNDILVEPGCLAALIACAEETGAGIVCPLYIQAGGGRAPTIHMAGGLFDWAKAPDQGVIDAQHRYYNAPLERAAGLVREKVDFPEYHYMLARTAFLNEPGAVSDDVLLMHEHQDLALFARERGVEVMFEPAARVTYYAFEPRPLGDLAFYRRRWDIEACRDSTVAYVQRWPRPDPAGLINGSMDYAADRLLELDLRRTGAASADDLAAPMTAAELAQSRYALREQALARGYADDDVRALEGSCDAATLIYDGLYRPDGRPFLSHGVGTASALLRYDLQIGVVRAGLLHAAFTHRPEWLTDAEVGTLLGGGGIEAMVRGQPAARAFLSGADADIDTLNMYGAGAAAILAANEVDMRFAGEYRATGRPPDMTPALLDRVGTILGLFGVSGLTASARQPLAASEAWPLFGAGVRQTSFRLDARNRRVLPV